MPGLAGAVSLALPAALSARPLSAREVEPAFRVLEACERADLGETETDLSDLRADWTRPDFSPARMTMGVFDGERLAATGEVFAWRAHVSVLPAYRGRGIGGWLLAWTEDTARTDARTDVFQWIGDGCGDAQRLLEANGYRPGDAAWRLRIDLDEEPPAPTLPDGLRMRDLIPGKDDREIYDLMHLTFSEWGHRSHGFENWAAAILRRPEVRPDTVPLAVDGDRIVGFALGLDCGPEEPEGWIQHLAVEKALRNRGIGSALLGESFRRFRQAGKRHAGLFTTSQTGALDLYLHLGMRVRRSYTRWSKDLG
jgi:mycothiol synthase